MSHLMILFGWATRYQDLGAPMAKLHRDWEGSPTTHSNARCGETRDKLHRDQEVSPTNRAPSVGQDLLILTCSGSGEPELRSLIRSRHGEGQALALR